MSSEFDSRFSVASCASNTNVRTFQLGWIFFLSPVSRSHHRTDHVRPCRRSAPPIPVARPRQRSAIVDRPRIKSLIADGTVKVIDDRLSISDGAEFLVRSIASAFDAHLAYSAAMHSRAV
jgi:hypothetical protein